MEKLNIGGVDLEIREDGLVLPIEKKVPSWQYEVGDQTLELFEEVNWKEIKNDSDEDCIFDKIDAEVHRLSQLIDRAQADIYKLRKCQRLLKKAGK